MDDRVDAGEGLRVDLIALGIPRHFVARARGAANEPANGVPAPSATSERTSANPIMPLEPVMAMSKVRSQVTGRWSQDNSDRP